MKGHTHALDKLPDRGHPLVYNHVQTFLGTGIPPQNAAKIAIFAATLTAALTAGIQSAGAYTSGGYAAVVDALNQAAVATPYQAGGDQPMPHLGSVYQQIANELAPLNNNAP